MRLLLLVAVALLVVDALYYDGAHTQAAQREVSATVNSLIATAGRELDRTAEREPEPAASPEAFRSGG
ncbi:MAG TPA: hypothetical protein VHG92_10060 [Afifellaceae bacterium]|nr:hypothetical protein [Afifellaceae bacterium]